MKPGGEDLLKQFNRGIDYAQNTFNIAEGVTSFAPTLLFKGVVIDVDFEVSKSTVGASLLPPFSVYAKIIGMDESSADPLEETERTYYPPFFPMHNICIPEVGEEVLIFKETPEPSAAGYYVGRINDSTPLNISYARDYIGINDPETSNSFRYGFNFDVRELRAKFSYQSPSLETANISIPLTFGDVVQQGRSKTYVRQSFNKNNKKGVLEQGIRLDGQLAPGGAVNQFRYYGANDPTDVSYKSTGFARSAVESKLYQDTETGEINEVQDLNEKVYGVSPNEMLKVSQDPSIGETSTKTIHFIDSSIKRLGNYSYQSLGAGKQDNNLEGEDKAMIVNIADEIYNISSRDVSGALYRQVLGEKLVLQQRQTYDMINQVLKMVSGFADSTQLLLDAFLEHEHALPKIELNIEKTIKHRDLYRTRTRVIRQRDRIIRLPSKRIRIRAGTRAVKTGVKYSGGPGDMKETITYKQVPNYTWITIPGATTRVPSPPRIIPGRYRTRNVKQKINFEAIIGGEENPRFTAPIETDTESFSESIGQTFGKTELGLKTAAVDNNSEELIDSFNIQQIELSNIIDKASDFLSRNQFIN